MDKLLGIRLGALLFTIIAFFGQFIFGFALMVGPKTSDVTYVAMVIGRFIFGFEIIFNEKQKIAWSIKAFNLFCLTPKRLGAESISVGQSVFIARWFHGKELAFAFGFSLAVSRAFSAFAFNILSPMGKYVGLDLAISTGTVVCAISILAAILAAILDKFGESVAGKASLDLVPAEPMRFRDILHFPLAFYILLLLCVFFNSGFFTFTSNAS